MQVPGNFLDDAVSLFDCLEAVTRLFGEVVVNDLVEDFEEDLDVADIEVENLDDLEEIHVLEPDPESELLPLRRLLFFNTGVELSEQAESDVPSMPDLPTFIESGIPESVVEDLSDDMMVEQSDMSPLLLSFA